MSGEAKVLIVDDEEVIHKLFKKMLVSESYQLFFATNGEDGLALFHQQKPDVVVLDYRMLGATGDEFMERLSDMELARTSVIMISGHAVPDIDLSERNQRKLFAYFEKPFFEMGKLKETIERAVQRNR
ncbi:MAG: response regulator [Gammaproteobacteria bacterium]|jgi:DNA-binding NtrC family response regulator|nr:response regulator [Gammaproteobacteria bacterium]MBT4608146.1 response regulator [Thiotrichales bacterium]MBT3471906.1 response regulator [Gammaproteobacteria bacterium]MBT3966672.1 response regulator [Gammaproteobacteria bacterium]MBT4081891.1 response regulator [Gammaproteobacteria bacterium]